jgi:hypothetical protein
VEVEQLAAAVGDLQRQVELTRLDRRTSEADAVERQQQLEQIAAERELLRRKLREREQELEDITSLQETSGAELFKLRRELDAAAHANERLSEALGMRGHEVLEPVHEDRRREWPPEALAEIHRLEGQLANVSQDRAGDLAAERARSEAGAGDRSRVRRLQLELEIRAQELEHMLAQLDGAEQRIWEMTDASDRNAARLAASLAQLEKHREQLDEVLDELEVTRNLLSAAQARAVEQERLLASERAKLARAGFGSEGLPAPPAALVEYDAVDALFAELDQDDSAHVDLQPIVLPTAAARAAAAAAEPAGIPTPVDDGGSRGSASRPIDLRTAPRMVVESIADADGWDDAADGADDGAPTSGDRPANARDRGGA